MQTSCQRISKHTLKLIAFELAGEDGRAKRTPRCEPFEICVLRVAETWLNGIFPLPREFCGQLRRKQLYLGTDFELPLR